MKTLWYFLKLSKKQWFFLSLGLLLSIVTMLTSLGLLSLAGYLICGAAIAGLAGAKLALSFNYFLPASGVRFFAMARIASRYGERVLTHDATFRLLKDLRVWFYQKLEPLAPGILLNRRSGDLLSRMISDIDALDKLYLRLAIPFISAILLVIFVNLFIGIFFSAILSYTLLIIFLLTIIVIPKITYEMGKSPSKKIISDIASLRTQVLELGSHLLEFILYGRLDKRLQQIEESDKELLNAQKQQAHIRGLTNAFILSLTSFSLVAVLVIGIPLVEKSKLLPANLGLLLLIVFAVFEAILVLPQACQYINETVFAGNRLLEIANTKPMIQFTEQEKKLQDYNINIHQIDFRYNNKTRKIFEKFSLEIPTGQHLAIIAETGRGKSTLAYLLTRAFDPESGHIDLGDQNLKQIPEAQLRQTICYISQDSHMFNATLKENLRLAAPNAVNDDLIKALKMVNMEEFANSLDVMMGEFGQRFSGGQIRRIALARAILRESPITILDEPFEGVDETTAMEIWGRIKPFFSGKTLIVITHQLSQISDDFKRVHL